MEAVRGRERKLVRERRGPRRRADDGDPDVMWPGVVERTDVAGCERHAEIQRQQQGQDREPELRVRGARRLGGGPARMWGGLVRHSSAGEVAAGRSPGRPKGPAAGCRMMTWLRASRAISAATRAPSGPAGG